MWLFSMKVYSTFFGNINKKKEKPVFDSKNLNKIYDCLNMIDFEIKEKDKLFQTFKYLLNLKIMIVL